MRKRIAILSLILLAVLGAARAEEYTGTVAAARSVTLTAAADGTICGVTARAGDILEAGTAVASLEASRVFASEDGTVSRVLAREGEEVQGTVLQVAPVSRYTIYCTAKDAYEAPNNMLVHVGETLYVKCSKDGSHRAVGVITLIDGNTYTVRTTGGELQVGEAVKLFRSRDFGKYSRVGVGTVVAADVRAYEGQGVVKRLCVEEGEYVERGELLCEIAPCRDYETEAPEAGIVTGIAANGASVKQGETICTLVPLDALCVTAQFGEDDAGKCRAGDTVMLIFADDREEIPHAGTVTAIASAAGSDGTYTVRIACETIPARLGLSVQVLPGK